MTKTEKQFSILYFVIVLFELLTGSSDTLQTAHFIAKPAIVFSLIFLFLKTSDKLVPQIKRLALSALMFSVAGDLLLMFTEQSSHFFTFGLMAFLLAHIMYILVFMKQRTKQQYRYLFIVILLVYACGLYYLLQEGLGEMLIPVIIYMIVILTMVAVAYLRNRKQNKVSYYFVLIGAILFVISDSILALNKFYASIPFSNISIMVSYAIAQYLIVLGILKINVTNSKV